MKINIEEIERLVKLQVGNGEAEALLEPIRELAAQRRYGLIWEEPKSGAYEEEHAEQALLENFPFLTELSEQAIVKNTEAPTNLLIEGDNLHALQALQYSHKGSVDVIYIDPPYNTGNKDFVYNDRFVEAEDSWRHSSWLSFMNKRLRLARELMTEDGVIFISIDDNEQAQLKLLCDQVFGEQNFITTIGWEKKKKPSFLKRNVGTKFEYIHVYARDIKKTIPFSLEKTTVGKKYPFNNAGNSAQTLTFPAKSVQFTRIKNEVIKAQDMSGGNILTELLDDVIIEQGINQNEFRLHGEWRYSQAKLDEFVDNKEKITIASVPFRPNLTKVGGEVKKMHNFFTSAHYGVETNEDATEELVDILGSADDFDYPKPVDLIKKIIKCCTYPKKDALILDFFAGSGTTGHAVMELNKDDEGNRQFILCTNNEISTIKELKFLAEKGHIALYNGKKGTNAYKDHLNEIETFKKTNVYEDLIGTAEYKSLGIARAVTYKRSERVINGYTKANGEEVAGLPNNLRYFLVDLKKDYRDEDFNAFRLIGETIDIIRIKENLYNHQESVRINGIPVVKLVDEQKEILIVLEVDVLSEDIDAIIQSFEDGDKEHIIYTSYNQYPFQNIKHEDLPKEILRALKMKEMS